MPDRVSPVTTVYIRAFPARDCGVVCGRTSGALPDVRADFPAAAFPEPPDDVSSVLPSRFAVDLSASFSAPAPPAGRMSGVSPPRLSPARTEHTGQAPGPCPSSTFSATAICWSLVARSARGAYAVPPNASQVDWVNCRPP
jgi:hypothetical protein